MTADALTGLDFDFLRYFDVVPENQQRIQAFYLPRFAGCRRVLDLGCGDGDFVSLLQERGVEGVGIDADAKACAVGQAAGLPIVQSDVFAYLSAQEPASCDGIFSAHLVEHLPYQQVVRLIDLSFRVLRPGGVIVLATPDARSLYAHLEMFYLHFGHVSFYHPRLLCFFLEHAGFGDVTYGANPQTGSPLMAGLPVAAPAESAPPPAIPTPGGQDDPAPSQAPAVSAPAKALHTRTPSGLALRLHSSLNRLMRGAANTLAPEVIQVLHDLWTQDAILREESARQRGQIMALENEIRVLRGDLRAVTAALQSLNGPFECFAAGTRPADGAEDRADGTAPRSQDWGGEDA